MKYSSGNDWVKFKPGVCRKTIAQVVDMSNSAEQLAAQIEACHFENDAGTVEELPTASEVYTKLTFQQFDWLGKQVIKFARDEALDPEA